jgi:hypothetical protein
MNTQTPLPEITVKGAHRIAVVINGAMIGSLIMMAAISEFVRPAMAGSEPGFVNILRGVFYVVGFSMILITRYVSSLMRARRVTDSPQLQLTRLLRASTITAALCEVPGILGVTLSVLGGQRADALILLGLSLGMCWVFFPRVDQWREWLGTAGWESLR